MTRLSYIPCNITETLHARKFLRAHPPIAYAWLPVPTIHFTRDSRGQSELVDFCYCTFLSTFLLQFFGSLDRSVVKLGIKRLKPLRVQKLQALFQST